MISVFKFNSLILIYLTKQSSLPYKINSTYFLKSYPQIPDFMTILVSLSAFLSKKNSVF